MNPILIIFATQNPKEISNQKIVNLPITHLMSPGYLVVNVALFAVYNSFYYTCNMNVLLHRYIRK